jgi:TonB family protein
MNDNFDDDEEGGPGPMRWVLAAGAIAAVGAVVFVLASGHHKPPAPQQQVIHVALPPPPKPPPPPPPPKQEVKQLEVKNTVATAKPIPNQPPKLAPKAPPAPALTAAAGAGTNNYGLQAGNGGGGSVIGGDGGGDGGGGNARWGEYAGQIQQSLEAALQRDERTRSGHYLLGLRIWLSGNGQITSAKIVATTGDPSLDQAIVAVIGGVSVGTPPPTDMPQPVNLQVRARTG